MRKQGDPYYRFPYRTVIRKARPADARFVGIPAAIRRSHHFN